MNIFTHWGSKPFENKLLFTSDKYVPDKNGEYFRAIDIFAPTELVYKWICQMKLAPYSYDKLDNKGKQSPQKLSQGIEKIKIGDKMMTIFRVIDFIPNKEVTIVMDIPPKPYDKFYVPTAITYHLAPNCDGIRNHTRLIVKYVASWNNTLLGVIEKIFIVFADFIMMRRQLLNFKKLAERDYMLNYKIK